MAHLVRKKGNLNPLVYQHDVPYWNGRRFPRFSNTQNHRLLVKKLPNHGMMNCNPCGQTVDLKTGTHKQTEDKWTVASIAELGVNIEDIMETNAITIAIVQFLWCI